MSEPTLSDDDREQRLEQAMAEYIQAEDAGHAPESQAFLAHYSDLRPELDEFLADRRELAWLVDPLAPRAHPKQEGTQTLWPSAAGQGSPQFDVTIEDAPAGVNGQEIPLINGTRVRYFGDYKIQEELGRGGMGIVYKATQVSLSRLVALKLIRAGVLADNVELRRFENEAEAVAQLDHPGIVPVYEVGSHDGQRYFSMKLIEGGSLASRIDGFTEDPRAAARLVAQAAEAVHHAHQRGILHRDLKPANILLDDEGRPHVTDFGLARKVDGDSELTQSGAILGTPAYMAPEQASGRQRSVTTASDVYGLGAILYALLTGRAPFGGESVGDTLDAVRTRPPDPPTRHNARIPRDLEVICLKCLEKDPQRRYTSARALAEDLRRHLAGEPILARPVRAAEQAWMWCRRNPALASMSGLTLAVAVLGFGGVTWQWRMAVAQRNRAEEAAVREEQARRTVEASLQEVHAARTGEQGQRRETDRLLALERQSLYRTRVAFAYREWLANDVGRADELLSQCPGDLRGWEWRYCHGLSHLDMLTLQGHTHAVNSIAFSPDSKRIVSGSYDHTARVWDTATGELLQAFREHSDRVFAVAFSPDGKTVASGGQGSAINVKMWDSLTGRETVQLRGTASSVVYSLVFSPDGKWLAASPHASVVLWDTATGEQVLRQPLAGIESVAFRPDGRWLAAANREQVSVLEVPTGKVLFTLSVPVTPECNRSLCFRPDGKRLAVASRWEVVVFDTETQKQVSVCRGHSFQVEGVAFSPDGKQLVSAGGDGTVRVWNAETGREIGTIRGHQSGVACVGVSSDGSHVASGGWDGVVKIWNAVPGAWDPLRVQFRGDGASLEDIAVSLDGKRVALARRHDNAARGKEGSVEFVDTASGTVIQTWFGHLGDVFGVAFSPDGRRLASISRPYRWSKAPGQPTRCTPWQLKIRDVDSGRELWSWEHTYEAPDEDRDNPSMGPGVRFSPDGVLVAAAESHRTLAVWEYGTGKQVAVLRGHDGLITDLAFSPDGAHLATSSLDGTVRLWDWRTGQEVGRLAGHTGAVNAIRFSPDGRLLATASADRTIRLWNPKNAGNRSSEFLVDSRG